MVCFIKAQISSFSAGTSFFFMSSNVISPSKNTPSLSGTGRQSLLTSLASSHSARSSAFDMVADRAIIWRLGFLLISFVSATSRVGPLPGSWIMWISSAITSPTESIHLLPWRIIESAFSDVATTMSASFMPPSSESRSPVLIATVNPRCEKDSRSSFFSEAKALRGTM